MANSGMIDSMHDKTANLRPTENGPPAVAILVPDGVTLFELGVASDVFGTYITTDSGCPLYRRYICGATPSVMTEAGFRMEVPYGLEALEEAGTVAVLPACSSPHDAPDAVLQALRLARSRGKRIISLCTGAFLLAAAGLLDGHAATTHWSECADLARLYPRVRVDPGVLYVDEGDVLTSAGSAASVDLCLHIVERDYGAEIAAKVARDLVVPLYRSGGQAQYIEDPIRIADNGDLFADTMEWLRTHLAETITVADLADRSAMSPRTFARRFLASTGTTPLAWLTRERLRSAQRLLETGDAPVDLVARESGFGSPDNLRKHFARTLRTTPQAYRRTFRAKAPA
jgi:AraC family transcriptional activator FtrA